MIIVAAYSFLAYIMISEDSIEVRYPSGKKKTLHTSQITVFGCVSYIARGTRIFFCTAEKEKIWGYYENHQKICKRLFGEMNMQKLMETEEGKWQLAVGTYLFHNPKDTLFLDGDTKRIATIVSILKRNAMVTGIALITTQELWEPYIHSKTDGPPISPS